MIDQVLNNIVTRLNGFIDTTVPDVVLGNLAQMGSGTESILESIEDKVVISVVNIQQESTLRNSPSNRPIYDDSGGIQGVARHPALFLNVYVLIGANKSNYNTALLRISQVLGFFQRNPIITFSEMPILPNLGLERIIFDLHSTDFEELNQLWSIMGGKYIPSVVYKMRMAFIDSFEEGATIPMVKTIDASFSNKSL